MDEYKHKQRHIVVKFQITGPNRSFILPERENLSHTKKEESISFGHLSGSIRNQMKNGASLSKF